MACALSACPAGHFTLHLMLESTERTEKQDQHKSSTVSGTIHKDVELSKEVISFTYAKM